MWRGLVLVFALIFYATSPALAGDGEEAVSPPPEASAEPKPISLEEKKTREEAVNKKMEELKRRRQEAEKNQAGANDHEPPAAMTKPQGPSPLRIGPEQEQYYKRIREIIASNWIIPKEHESGDWNCMVRFSINPDGAVSDIQITQSSGISDVDEATLQAMKKSSPLPALPPGFEGQAQTIAIAFSSDNYFGSKRRDNNHTKSRSAE